MDSPREATDSNTRKERTTRWKHKHTDGADVFFTNCASPSANTRERKFIVHAKNNIEKRVSLQTICKNICCKLRVAIETSYLILRVITRERRFVLAIS